MLPFLRPTAAAEPIAPYPFMRWRRAGFALTLALIVAAFAALGLRGLNLGLDFTGGVLVQAEADQAFDSAQLRAALAANGLDGAVVQLSDGDLTALVRARTEAEQTGTAVAAIRDALGPEARVMSADAVGPKVSGELFRDGAIACALAVFAIGVYVWLRFEAKFGIAAFLTTLHDVVILVGLFAISGLVFDLTSIAALLAVAGYSINDTVIIYDRIRENLARDKTSDVDLIIDKSLTETLRRTLMTSGTTLATTVALMLFGGPVLFGFAAAISFGILIGTYSSIFVAAPLLLHLPGRIPGRDEDEEAQAAPAA
jgi:preprotein translocase SecF subunit